MFVNTNTTRVLVLFVIITFWYWFSLYLRRERHESSRSDWVWYWVEYLGWYWEWGKIVTAEILLMPLSYLTVAGLSYVFTGSPSFEVSVIISCILWIAFYAGETGYYHLEDFISFDISDIPWFVFVSIILDVTGIIFSLISFAK